MTVSLHILLMVLIIANNASFIADILHLRIGKIMQRMKYAQYEVQLIQALEKMGELVYGNSTTISVATYANSSFLVLFYEIIIDKYIEIDGYSTFPKALDMISHQNNNLHVLGKNIGSQYRIENQFA